jgi:hypothetical protein
MIKLGFLHAMLEPAIGRKGCISLVRYQLNRSAFQIQTSADCQIA